MEERSSCSKVPSAGEEYVDDLAMLVNRSLHVAPFPGDVDVGFVDEWEAANRVSARSCRIDQHGSETLDPAVDRDVIHFGTAFGEKIFNVAVRQPVSGYQRTASMITSGGNR